MIFDCVIKDLEIEKIFLRFNFKIKNTNDRKFEKLEKLIKLNTWIKEFQKERKDLRFYKILKYKDFVI